MAAYNNAMAESFVSTLECELLARRRFHSRPEARMALFSYIEGFYDPARRHSALGYCSPLIQEQEHQPQPATRNPQPATLVARAPLSNGIGTGPLIGVQSGLIRPH